MKLSPHEKEQQRAFMPSRLSAEGFLGTDRRSVDEIVAADRQIVESLGSSGEKIASFLTDIFDRAEALFGNVLDIKSGVTAVHRESRGKIPSPFRGGGLFQKGEVEVSDASTGETMIITRLGIDLIRKRCFFQGRGNRYRIEPETVIRLFGSHG